MRYVRINNGAIIPTDNISTKKSDDISVQGVSPRTLNGQLAVTATSAALVAKRREIADYARMQHTNTAADSSQPHMPAKLVK